MTLADLDLSKDYSYADFFNWQFEERIELIKGKIFTMSRAKYYAPKNFGQYFGAIVELFKGTLKSGVCSTI
jgi:hypothetical protein